MSMTPGCDGLWDSMTYIAVEVPRSNLVSHTRSFLPSTAQLWDSLPAQIPAIRSRASFSREVKRFLDATSSAASKWYFRLCAQLCHVVKKYTLSIRYDKVPDGLDKETALPNLENKKSVRQASIPSHSFQSYKWQISFVLDNYPLTDLPLLSFRMAHASRASFALPTLWQGWSGFFPSGSFGSSSHPYPVAVQLLPNLFASPV